MIKLGRIRIEGFRGIPGLLDVDLSAPITLIYAPNGVGKTSICDAAEWLLTNSIKRLEESAAEVSDFRCDFAASDVPTRVTVSMIAYGETLEVERLLGSCRWRRNSDVYKAVSQSDFLEALAPSAVETNVHKTHANHSRQIWLRGTRFLSGDSLAALLESDSDSMGNRERLFADMLGVGHLIETERQLEIYSKHINQYVKQQTTLIENRRLALRQRQASLDHESRENEKTLLPHSLAKATEALNLLHVDDIPPVKPEPSVSDMRRMIAFLRGELERKKNNWNERRSAEISLAADWPSRFILTEQQSVDQEKSRELTEKITQITKEVGHLREQVEANELERAGQTQSLISDQAIFDNLKNGLAIVSNHLNTYTKLLPERSVFSYQDVVALSGEYPLGRAFQSFLQLAGRTRSDVPEILREGEELRVLRSVHVSLPSAEGKQQTENDLAAAKLRVASLHRDHERIAGPIEQLRHLSASIVDMLTHAEQCPVCAHNWGSAEALRQALNTARKAESPEIWQLASNLEKAEAEVRRLQDELDSYETNVKRATEIDAKISSLEARRTAFFERFDSLGLKVGTDLSALLDGLYAKLSFIFSVRPLLDELSRVNVSNLPASLPIIDYVSQASTELQQRMNEAVAQIEELRKNSATFQLDLERRTRTKSDAEREQVALQQKIENTEFRIHKLRAGWRVLGGERPWTSDILAELSTQLLQENSELLLTEELIDQAERLMEASANLDEISKLESELAPIEAERNRLTSYALAAEVARKAYFDMRQQHVRRQMEEFVRVISALFTRMQSNEVYDRISEGDASSPLSWRAISEGFAMNPDLRFSQGQRQDFALSIFLARARGLGGTFFMDEPLVHLDDLNRVALLDVFRAICLESNQKISIVLTTASKATLRHFVEKFTYVSRDGQSQHTPLLRVIHLEGNPRAGVSLRY
jgi:DNA repair protein SbcC/Rad50